MNYVRTEVINEITMEARCLAVTPRIEAKARIMDENCHVTAVEIALWQEEFNKDIDEYPSAGELIEFVTDLRSEESFLPIAYEDYGQLLFVLGPRIVEAIGMEYIYPRVNEDMPTLEQCYVLKPIISYFLR